MKTNKNIYTFLQMRNAINDDHMNDFNSYVKAIKYYGGRTDMNPGLVKAKRTKVV